MKVGLCRLILILLMMVRKAVKLKLNFKALATLLVEK